MEGITPQMDVAVIGVGRMGQHHARTYADIDEANLVGVVDMNVERAAEVAENYGSQGYASVDDLLATHPNVKAVTVAVPTVHHGIAEPLLERGIACLVEKPLAGTVAEAKHLAEIAKEHGTCLQVGHTERFNPAVRAVTKMGLPPRFMEVNRISPLTFRSLDVGVVMDMMIHDLDIVLSLAQSRVKRVDATGICVVGEHEDIANARVVFESGCVANITASRLAMKTDRRLRLFSESAYVSLDYQKRDGMVIRMSDNADALKQMREGIASGKDLSDLDYSELIDMSTLDMDLEGGQDDPLTAELTSFLHAAHTGAVPVVDAEAGYAAVALAEQIVAAVNEHTWEGLDGKTV